MSQSGNQLQDIQVANQYFISGPEDPTSYARLAVQGTIYIRVGKSGGSIYQKLDNGLSTNWRRISDRMWFSGEGPPSSRIGQKNDWYTNNLTGDVYEKVTELAWEQRGDLTPPAVEAYKPKKLKKVVDNTILTNSYFEIYDLVDDDASLLFLNSRPLIEGEEYVVTRHVDITRFTLIGSILPGQVEAMDVGDLITGIYFIRR